MTRNKIVATVVIILVVAAAVWILLPQAQTVGAQIIVGKVAIPIAALIALWKSLQAIFPERVKLFVATLLRKFGYLPLGLKRVVVRNEVEGNLNGAVKEFGCEGKRLLPYPASLTWATSGELSPDSFFRDGRIIIRLDYSENPHRNIVEAALLYCKAGLVPETRRYLWSEFRHALDVVFVQAMLERNDLREGLLYFKQDVLERELKTNPGVQKDYDTLYGLHEHGYFTRILLPELRDYAGRVHTTDTHLQHQQWIADFTDFLMEATREHPAGTKWALDHISKRLRVSMIIVGEYLKLAFKGQRPYLKQIARCATLGARTVFLIGTSGAIPVIANNARKLGIADSSECESYHMSLRQRIQQVWCARIEISEQTAVSALDRVPDIENWPDLKAKEGTKATAPVRSPVTKATAPVRSPVAKATAPVRSPVTKATAPVRSPVTKATAPVRSPVTKATAPVRSPVAKATAMKEAHEKGIDAAWSKRAAKSGESIYGALAGLDATKVLDINKLKESQYKNLQGILIASQYLYSKWLYKDNYIIRR